MVCEPGAGQPNGNLVMHEKRVHVGGCVWTERWHYRAIVTAAKRLQSGRLDTYVAYMFIALVAVTAPTIAMA